jgi:hypothetical protein
MERSGNKKVSLLPGQVMASVEELKKNLNEAKGNVMLIISILNSLIHKLNDIEKIPYLKQKIELLIDEGSFLEARIDAEALVALDKCEEHKLLYCKLFYKQQDYLNCMTQLLKLKNVNNCEVFERNVEELANSTFFDSLYVIPNLPDLYSSQITFFPELRGKVVLQICSSSYLTYILISTCPHLAQKSECPSGLYNCSEELQLLEVSNSILSPIDFLTNQKLSQVSCSDTMTGVLDRTGRITLWGDLPEGHSHLILDHPCSQMVVGSSFICMVREEGISFWGRLGNLSTLQENYSSITEITDKTGHLSCSDNHLLLLSEGNVFSLGLGEEGQLGLGVERISISTFEAVQIPQQVTQVLCNNEVSVALTREVIYVWGLVNPLQLNEMPRNV